MDPLKTVLAKIATGETLSQGEAASTFDALLEGVGTPAQVGALLMALRLRGETVDEITGAVSAMRAKMLPVAAPPDAIDVVGTGGDGHGTFNISTLAAIITAACGVPVAKHGNRAASSRSGASDVLAALGVAVGGTPAEAERCLARAGIAFLAAPVHHGAMRHVAGVRAELGLRTIFNLLGPLSNPAGARRLLLGVFARRWLEPLAEVLGRLGADRAWLVHGSDGMDEITTTGETDVVALDAGRITRFTIRPEDYGLPRASLASLRGADPAHNAAALSAVLAGARNPYRDIAVLNAGAALVVAGHADGLDLGVARAARALDSGDAAATLDRLVLVSNGGDIAAMV